MGSGHFIPLQYFLPLWRNPPETSDFCGFYGLCRKTSQAKGINSTLGYWGAFGPHYGKVTTGRRNANIGNVILREHIKQIQTGFHSGLSSLKLAPNGLIPGTTVEELSKATQRQKIPAGLLLLLYSIWYKFISWRNNLPCCYQKGWMPTILKLKLLCLVGTFLASSWFWLIGRSSNNPIGQVISFH